MTDQQPEPEPQPEPAGEEQNGDYPNGEDVTEVDDHGGAVG